MCGGISGVLVNAQALRVVLVAPAVPDCIVLLSSEMHSAEVAWQS